MPISRARRSSEVDAKARHHDAKGKLMQRVAHAIPRLVAVVGGVALIAAMTLSGSAAGATQTISAPSSGAAGAIILITGSGWPGFDNVDADLEAGATKTFFCSFSADASGKFQSPCTLPTALPRGTYTLLVTDNTLSASSSFTLNPGAQASATSSGAALTAAAAGQNLFLRGFGFDAVSSIKSVKIGTTAVTTTPAAPSTSSTGAFSGATFVVPSTLAAGLYAVTVTDAAAHSAKFSLNIYAATDSAPSSGAAGRNLALSGTGWPVNDNVDVELSSGGTNTFFCSIVTDASGNLGPTLCTLPNTLPQGGYTLLLTDGSVMVTKAFTLDPGVHVSGTSTGAAITSVAAGQNLFLSGVGFAAGTTITSVKVGTTAVTTTPAAPSASASGAFSSATFTVPKTAKAGLTAVTVTDASSHSATLHLTVFKATDTAASSGKAGKSLTVSGAGWAAGDNVDVELSSGGTNTFFCSIVTDPDGNLGPSPCLLPSTLAQGSYTLLLTDGSVMVTKSFTLNPGVVVQGTASGGAITLVASGQTVFLSGSGFAGSSTITSVKVGTTAVSTTPATPSTSVTGAFSGVTFKLPAATPAGTTTVTVTDAASHSTTLPLKVFAATDTSAGSGNAGQRFLITGSGWPLADTVDAFLVQGSTQTFFCSLSADGNGNLGPAVCTLPTALPQGSYTLSLTDGSVVVDSPFTLNPGVTLTNTSSQPIDSAAPGSTVDFSGVGFVAVGTIKTVKIGTTTVTTSPAAPGLSPQGSFSGASFVVPSSMAAGNYTVTVTDSSGKKATAPLAVT